MRLFIAVASFVMCVVCLAMACTVWVYVPYGIMAVPVLIVAASAMAYNCATFTLDAIRTVEG